MLPSVYKTAELPIPGSKKAYNTVIYCDLYLYCAAQQVRCGGNCARPFCLLVWVLLTHHLTACIRHGMLVLRRKQDSWIRSTSSNLYLLQCTPGCINLPCTLRAFCQNSCSDAVRIVQTCSLLSTHGQQVNARDAQEVHSLHRPGATVTHASILTHETCCTLLLMSQVQQA